MTTNLLRQSHDDKSREGPTLQKVVLQPLRLLWPKNNYALAKVEKFTDINLEAISKHFKKKIRAVILDVDDCVAEHHGNVLPKNSALIKQWIHDGIQIIVFSNMIKTDRYAELEALGIEVHTGNYAKPDARGFIECLKKLGTTAEETVMIGDNFLTDGGSIRAGVDFIKVKPITDSTHKRSFKRSMQVGFRGFFEKISNLYDRALKRNLWQAERD